MTDRRDQKGSNEQFHQLFGADAFLDDLSRGEDPSRGKDPLAALLLELHQEVHAPIPPAPSLDQLLPAEADNAPTAGLPKVDELAQRRAKKRPVISRWQSALVGAAAATLLIAGGGGAIYNAGPQSPLWNAKTTLFGEHAAVVDLASALQEVDQRHSEGDVEGAMRLLERARALADAVNTRDRESMQRAIADLEARTKEAPTTVTQSVAPETETSTVTSVPSTTAQAPVNPDTVTETVTKTTVETKTVTVTVAPEPEPTPATSTSATATPTESSATTTAKVSGATPKP